LKKAEPPKIGVLIGISIIRKRSGPQAKTENLGATVKTGAHHTCGELEIKQQVKENNKIKRIPAGGRTSMLLAIDPLL
jgi:hypothetical protein